MPRESRDSGPAVLVRRFRSSPLVEILAFAGWTALVYRRGFSSGVIADGWVMLEIGSRGLWQAVRATLGYHTIPVTNLFTAVLWRLFGFAEQGYQLLNLAQLALVGWLLSRLGRRLFADPRIGLVAGLLFVANASFYDVTLWPVVGNFHSLAALLYLGGLFAVLRAQGAPRPAPWAALFAGASLGAFLTYEPAISVAPVGVLLAHSSSGGDATARSRTRRALVAALLVVVVVILRIKVWAFSEGSVLAKPPMSFDAFTLRLFHVVRAAIALFTLRGDDGALYTIFSFGTWPDIGSRAWFWLLAGWLLVLAAAVAFLAVKAREPALRFVVLWLAVHLVMTAAVLNPVSRHFYLAAMPASILAACALWRVALRLAALVRPPSAPPLALIHRHAATALALAFVIALAGAAQRDLTAAAALHDEVTQATRRVSQLVRRRLRDPVLQEVVFVNLPNLRTRGGVGALAFANGTVPMLRLVTGGKIPALYFFFTYEARPRERFTDGALPISLGVLTSLARDPRAQVLLYDNRSGDVVELRPATWRIPGQYSPDSAPYLAWQEGTWPWLRLHRGLPLQLPLAAPDARSWIALRYRRAPETSFTVLAGDQPPLRVDAPAGTLEGWPAVTLPVEGLEPTVEIQPHSEVWLAGVWSFAAPASYSPEDSPFLGWNPGQFPAFTVTQPLSLPLANPACAGVPCRLEIEYLAEEGRAFDLTLREVGPPVRLGVSAAPEWQTAVFAGPELADLESVERTVVITPRGAAPVAVRRLAWTPSPPTVP